MWYKEIDSQKAINDEGQIQQQFKKVFLEMVGVWTFIKLISISNRGNLCCFGEGDIVVVVERMIVMVRLISLIIQS